MRAWHSIIILFLLAPKASGQQLAKLVASVRQNAQTDMMLGLQIQWKSDTTVQNYAK